MLPVHLNMPMPIFASGSLQKHLESRQEEIELYAERAMNYKNVFDDGTKAYAGTKSGRNIPVTFQPLQMG